MRSKRILIYGATGYTGKLLAKELICSGVSPILAARSNKVHQVAKSLDCEARVFTLQDAALRLDDVDILINVAGPFRISQDLLIRACLQTRTHYLDIAGEAPDIENAARYHKEALDAGITILPGAGFGVVPTDLLALCASRLIPNPTRLRLVYQTIGGASRGTLRTVLSDIDKPGVKRVRGSYQKAMPAESFHEDTIGNQSVKAAYNPWRADLYTAFVSTGIDNIETYTVFPAPVVKMMQGKLGFFRKILLKVLLPLLPEGPGTRQLKKGKTLAKVTVNNEYGQEATAEMQGPEAYVFTVQSIIAVIQAMRSSPTGYLTPAQLINEWPKEWPPIKVWCNHGEPMQPAVHG
ncbi:trans-acting enoyl reductase family protein [Roseivirga sp. BDSF3-8]|uniref:saccharopine dehydrogenase family protein n=1 Tax=Roseivirga sp. BDSF3-8 TaxID=3241598 RepID=UPI003531BA77